MNHARPWKKVATFGLLGAVGCLLGWAFGEGLLAVGLPASSAQEGPSLASRPEAPPPPPPPEAKRGVAPPSPAAPVVAKREPPPPLPPEVQKLLEAAGGKSGQLHFVLTWQQQTDLDLHCIDPNGEEIFYGHKKALKGSGGELDVDRTGGNNPQIENLRFLSAAPLGHYRIYVNYFSGSSGPTAWRLISSIEDERTETTGSDLKSGTEKWMIQEFDLPGIRLAVPPEVVLYPGGKNKLRVRLERDRQNTFPVRVKFVDETNTSEGLVLLHEATLPGDKDEADLDIEAMPGIKAGTRDIKVEALGRYGTTKVRCKIAVKVPPATLQLVAATKLGLQAGSSNALPIRIARDWFDGPVKVRAVMPSGVSSPEITIVSISDSGEMIFTATEAAATGSFPVKLVAEGGAAKAETSLTLEMTPAPPPPSVVSSFSWRLVLVIGLWTALLATGLSLALVVGQNRHLGRPWLSPREAVVLLLGGGLAGFVAGGIGQTLFSLMARTDIMPEIGFLAGWLLLGGLLGRGVGFFIPNLDPWRSTFAGILGGLLGAGAFILISKFGNVPGRIVGAALLGFCIGMMVALVELAFRRAWLEVRFGGGETITVNLGPEPVKVGGDGRQCAVWARGAEAVALRYWLRDGRVVCDVAGQGERLAANGDRRQAGSVEVIVRTANSGAATVAQPAPSNFDDDDDLPLPPPKPVSRTVPPPASRTVPPPASRTVPPPASRPLAAQPSKAVPKPATRSAYNCPECGAGVEKPSGVCSSCGAMY